MRRFPLFYIILPILMAYAAVVFSSDSAVDFGERIDYSHTVYSIQMRDSGGIDFKDELGAIIMTLDTDGNTVINGTLAAGGALTAYGTATVVGAAAFGSTVDVYGNNTVDGGTLDSSLTSEHLIFPSPGVPAGRPVLEIMSDSNVTGGIQFNANATDYWNQYYGSTAFILNHGTWAGVPTGASFTVLSNGNIGNILEPADPLHFVLGDQPSLSAMKLVNNEATLGGSAVGITFGVGAAEDVQTKGGLAYIRTGPSAKGEFRVLQNAVTDSSSVSISDTVLSIANTGILAATVSGSHIFSVTADGIYVSGYGYSTVDWVSPSGEDAKNVIGKADGEYLACEAGSIDAATITMWRMKIPKDFREEKTSSDFVPVVEVISATEQNVIQTAEELSIEYNEKRSKLLLSPTYNQVRIGSMIDDLPDEMKIWDENGVPRLGHGNSIQYLYAMLRETRAELKAALIRIDALEKP